MDELRPLLRASAGDALLRFAALTRDLGPAATAPVPACPGWTASDVAAHVLTVCRRGLGDRRRSGAAEGTAALNDTCLAELAERRPHRLADRLVAEGAEALRRTDRLPGELEVPFHAGTLTTIVPILAVLLGEFLVHGHDVADAADMPWPLPGREAALVLAGLRPVLAAWLDQEGAALAGPALGSAAPAAALLSLYGRTAPPTAALAELRRHTLPI